MTRRDFLFATILGVSALFLYAFTLPDPPAGWKAQTNDWLQPFYPAPQTTVGDTLPPLSDRKDNFMSPSRRNPIDLQDPKVIEKQIEYDPVTDRYIVVEKIGEDYFRTPSYMTFEEYMRWREKKQREEHFNRMLGVTTPGSRKSAVEDPAAKFDVKTSLVERLFGGTNIDIKPQGNVNLRIGYQYQKIQNPILTLRQQRIGNFDFEMDINMSASGQVGEKLKVNFNFNNRAVFDFDNQMKIHYDPKGFSEDEIIQNIEAGNVSLPMRSNLIPGVQNLFGIKTGLKFGHLNVTLLAAQQRSRQNNLTLQGGSQVQQFVKPADEYDENRHFFISHWNREQFEPALACLPVPMSLFNITRMEVWLTNVTRVPDNTRDIVAFMDLGEPKPYLDGSEPDRPDFSYAVPPARDIKGQPLPTNENNRLYAALLELVAQDSTVRFSDKIVARLRSELGLQQVRDFEKVRGRLLSPNEYTYNEQLGFLSINTNVQPDQVVAIAVEYTYNGKPYKIGEFSSDVPNTDTFSQNVLFLKMLKSTTANVRYPIWDLMMKNVYSIGAVNVDPQEFRFDIFYEDPGKGQRRFLNAEDIPPGVAGVPLLQLFRMDSLNLQGDPGPDGIFDFVPGLTINLRNGRVMFPVLEPFGEHLARKLRAAGASEKVIEKYTFPQLYDSTLFRAREFQQLNRFTLRGSYKSSTSSEISLGTFNLPRGSVRVSAGGRQLVEGQDYIVDYNIGKIRILNEAYLQSGQPINVSFEDNSLFSFQNRSLFGARFDYTVGKDLNIGATYMNLFERPLIQKVNFGDDPINNRMYGLDFNLSKEVPWITRLIDKLPLIDTKAPSTITAQAEVALLHPGHNRAINVGGDRGGVVYIDDFEGSTANLPLANPANSWVIASVPDGDPLLFPEASLTDSLALGANRARLSWYIADPSARDAVDAKNPYTRIIQFQDIFPNRQLTPLEVSALRPLDVTIFPRERGPYNFERPDGYPGISKGLTINGELDRPETRWAGFMRGLFTVDFEAANIEFIEFWMLNPYMEKGDGTPISADGDMYIDLGNISEDIMRDGRQFFENALPTGPGTSSTTNSAWGRVPVLPPVVNAFDNDPAKRPLQDLGLDGLDDEDERKFFAHWLNIIQNSSLSPKAKAAILEDPSNDNFRFFRDPIYEDTKPGLLERYKHFNSQQGNSPVNETVNLNPASTNFPDAEDLNRDNSLNETEAYFRYKIPLKKRTITFNDGVQMQVIDTDHPELRDLITDTVVFDRDGARFVWYRFKLPLDHPRRQTINGIQDFRSIRFIRIFWKGFTERTTFRFATLELGRNQWRRYTLPLPNVDPGQTSVCDVGKPTNFDVNAVSIEQNAARTPFNYTIPPGIARQQSVGAFPDILQNEQALSMNMCDLAYCDARAVFKILNMDLRQFDRLKMFAHAEGRGGDKLDSTHLRIFIRLGSDFVSNYYEYELPLTPSDETRLNGNPESREYKIEVWRPENNFNIPLRLFTEIKKQRNATPNWDLNVPFIGSDPDEPRARVKVVGNPNLGYVRGVMVGVRNVDPNLQPHCAEVWINELRLNGFNEQLAYAGQTRLDIKLADLGNISLSGRYTSIGWGSMEQKLVQRQREEVAQYDLSANLELGRFFPKDFGLRLPFYVQYSNITRTPEFDPYDLDIKLREKLRQADPRHRDSIRRSAQEVTIIRGYNFTNVRKDRVGLPRKVRLPWNIENFSLTYAFNQERRRTPFIEFDEINRYKGTLDWQYATGLKPIEPFKNLVKNDKLLRWLKEINFNPLPNTYAFNTTLERVRQVTTYRFAGEDPALNTYFNRRFTWDRNYDLGWEITRNLRFNFNAQMRSLIDEPQPFFNGEIVTPQERRDSILKNLRRLGRPKNYTHSFGINYTLPLRYLPLLDWIIIRASYNASYTWTAQSLKLQFMSDVPPVYAHEVNLRSLGHVIQNQSARQINGELNFETLYNKSRYLAKINSPGGRGPGGSMPPGGRGNPLNRTLPGGFDRPDMPGGIDLPMMPGGGGLGPGRDIPPSGRNLPTPNAPLEAKPTDSGTPSAEANKDKTSKKDKRSAEKKRRKQQERQPSVAERIALRPLMLVRKARFTYSENYNTVVPGFTPDVHLMGLSQGFQAPGWAFVAGFQPSTEWLYQAAANGWITQRPELNQQVTRNYTQNADIAVTLEPFREFRIELTANRQHALNNTELFKDQSFILHPDSTDYQSRAYRDFGSFTVSYFSLKTMFDKNINGLFARYEAYRSVISDRLAQVAGNLEPHDKDGPAYRKGYGKIQQEVLLPSFIAAYTGIDPKTVPLDIFKTLPAPNWRLSYNGLHKVKPFDKIFANVQITHSYRNTLTINSFNTDIFFDRNNPYQLDTVNFNYIARFEIPQVVINEQFAPLLGLDVRLKNDMTFKVDYKKSRMLAMSFVDYQLAETQSTGLTIGFGYRLRNVNIAFLTGKKKPKSRAKKTPGSAPTPPPSPGPFGGGQQANDMTFKFDLDIRDDVTVNHRLDQLDEAVPTRGSRIVSINPSVDYALNRRLTLRLFADYRRTVPKTSQSFPITTLNTGVMVRFSLN